ncbi:hypothetical protein EI42_04056 [Thermosporothrix hazakensis]|uniref:Uncharacterized protein n=1 Tax=Thermosporothrix hazakensis TaxID=644383 RepID=A0A326U4J7_THEHA|nr:hypothetical protein EI42_04056 [Thermosporothrix hazakensis]GCE51357.1 hypothetical protein KTH_62260 [Thermosporothrix hazakensis]
MREYLQNGLVRVEVETACNLACLKAVVDPELLTDVFHVVLHEKTILLLLGKIIDEVCQDNLY